MTCQHPNCSQPIHSLCTNHCHWSLCQEHINEHRKSLLTEFEEVLQDLIRPTNELSKSFEQTKTSFNANQQTELDQIKQSHQKEIHKIEQQLIEINKFQDQYNQISEHLNKIKTNENILTQNHFQQMDILFKEINQFKNSFTGSFSFIHFSILSNILIQIKKKI
jgi:DNA anti-recombination protein RmuC